MFDTLYMVCSKSKHHIKSKSNTTARQSDLWNIKTCDVSHVFLNEIWPNDNSSPTFPRMRLWDQPGFPWNKRDFPSKTLPFGVTTEVPWRSKVWSAPCSVPQPGSALFFWGFNRKKVGKKGQRSRICDEATNTVSLCNGRVLISPTWIYPPRV